jgi:hypothetical protein
MKRFGDVYGLRLPKTTRFVDVYESREAKVMRMPFEHCNFHFFAFNFHLKKLNKTQNPPLAHHETRERPLARPKVADVKVNKARARTPASRVRRFFS